MEHIIGTPAMPLITILNNTDEEIYNVSVNYTYKTLNCISFNTIPAHSTAKSALNLKDIDTPISLLLNYSHNETIENQLILKSLKKSNNIVRITLEINIENNNYVITTIIERDIKDTSITLSQKNHNTLLKSLSIIGTIILVSYLCCYLHNKNT